VSRLETRVRDITGVNVGQLFCDRQSGTCVCVCVCVCVCSRLPLLCRNNDGHQGVLQGHRRWNMTVSLRVQVLLH